MAIRFTKSNSEYLSRTSGTLLDFNADYTVCGWLRWATLSSWGEPLFLGINGGNQDAIVCNAGQLYLYFNNAGTTGGTVSANTWYFVALVRSGTGATETLTLYVDHSVSATRTATIGARGAITRMHFGCWTDGSTQSEFFDGRAWGWKAWQRALSVDEMKQEARSAMPFSFTSIWEAWPFLDGDLRPKGFLNGRDWTETNTPTSEDPPPVPYRRDRGDLFVPAGATGTTVTPTTATLTTTTFAPTVTTTEHISVTPTTASLTTTAYAPVLGETTTPTTATLVTTAYAPVLGETVTPTTAELTTTGYAPTLAETVTPAIVELVITTYAPDVVTGGDQDVEPTTATLVLTTFAPTVTATGELVIPTTATLVLTTFEPWLFETVTPTTLALAITTYAPDVVVGAWIVPEIAELALTTYAPGVVTSLPMPVVTVGAWSASVDFVAGDEWFVTLDGPSCDAPKARVCIRFYR